MNLELDHLFICADAGAPEADRLIEFGLKEGPSNIHPGQGTANRRFFFENAMLELVWVQEPAEARSELARPTYLWERWIGRKQFCPFGFCLRPTESESIGPPFPAWKYSPPYLPAPMHLWISNNAPLLAEPVIFSLGFVREEKSQIPAEFLRHPSGLTKLTRVEWVSPPLRDPSEALKFLVDSHLIGMTRDEGQCLELGFDGESKGEKMDFRPQLPLVFFW